MEIISQSISDVRTIRPSYFHDHRGYFVESYNKKKFAECGINIEFVQDNLSFTAKNGTVKGLHFQARPFEQWKLISVVAGSVFDVAVDIRKGSPTYGKYVGSVLDSENGNQTLVPAGFAHGFVALEDATWVSYKVSNYYSPDHEKGIHWADPDIAIDWPGTGGGESLSDKDSQLPKFSDLPDYFTFSDGKSYTKKR